ncbi:mandelate racemase/muconate lactonizing enzyme family protein [Georgenia sp. Z1491]|uniref:mandelate racemase/muconate lactonizing enzyme family protein n=1 Tax=Georgenia sp. Z1491 TaxID=3416707 RepID=UPI003CEC4D8B
MVEIVAARSWILRIPLPGDHVVGDENNCNVAGVTLETADGHIGRGFGFTVEWDGSEAIRSIIDMVLLPAVIGRSSHDVADIWNTSMLRIDRVRRGLASIAIGAVDMALWDLAAVERGISLADHVGKVRASVPAYSSGQFAPTLPMEKVIENVHKQMEMGLTAVKLRVGMDPEKDLSRVSALRSEFGDALRIMCDANQRLVLPEAIWLGRRLADLGVYWFEEPMPARDVDGHVALAKAIDVPIAVGEHLQSAGEFKEYARRGAAHLLQPDVGQLAGPTEFFQISEMARSEGVALAPHFLPEIHIHLMAAYPNAAYLEQFPWVDKWLVSPLQFENGHALIPDTVGHGFELVPDAIEQFLVAGRWD